MLEQVDEKTTQACCWGCVDGLVESLNDQLSLVKLMKNAHDQESLIKKTRVQMKLIPRRFERNQAARAKSDAIVAAKSATTVRAAIQNVLAAARERDAAAKRAIQAKKKKEKAARQRAAKAAAPPPAPPPPAPPSPPSPPATTLDDLGPDAHLCVVCMVNVKNIVHLGCGHVATCSECSAHLSACPLCREPVKLPSMLMQVRVF